MDGLVFPFAFRWDAKEAVYSCLKVTFLGKPDIACALEILRWCDVFDMGCWPARLECLARIGLWHEWML